MAKAKADVPAGPSIQASRLSARAGAARPEWCPSAEEDGSIPLPPEQRGKIGRYLADDEGEVPGRWMDVPMPNEIWGGAVGLTKAMVECALLPIPGVNFTPTGGLPPQPPKREAEVPEGTEMEERAPASPQAKGRVKDAASGDESDDGYAPDCVTRVPDPGCVPGEPAASGPKIRSVKNKMTYFREDPDGTLPTPSECFADLGTFSVQAADHMCPLQLFIPGPPPRGEATEGVLKAPPAPPAALLVPRQAQPTEQAQAQAEPGAVPTPAQEGAAQVPRAAEAAADEAEPPAALPPAA